jgi:hypothetical protein
MKKRILRKHQSKEIKKTKISLLEVRVRIRTRQTLKMPLSRSSKIFQSLLAAKSKAKK